jgi:hypothetical protein
VPDLDDRGSARRVRLIARAPVPTAQGFLASGLAHPGLLLDHR